MLLVASTLILILIISVAALVMLRQKETFSNYGSPSETGNLLLSKIPDICSSRGVKSDCINTMGCMYDDATGMCQKVHNVSEGFVVSEPDCATYTDCATCAGADDCGWCKTNNTCYTQDRFGTSTGRCNPETNFSTFPSTCGSSTMPNFDIGASELLGNASFSATTSVPASAPASTVPMTITDTPANRVECQRLVNGPMPPVTDPALRRLHNETVAQCLKLLTDSSISGSASASPTTASPTTTSPTTASPTTTSPTTTSPTTASPTAANPANIQVQFSLNDVPSIGTRIRQDITRLMNSIGI